MDQRISFNKFDGKNFHTWQVKMRLLLTEKNLWDLVDGSKIKQEDSGDSSSLDLRDKRAAAYIGLGLADSQIHHLDLSKTAREIWQSLEAIFGARSKNGKILLKQQFFALKLERGMSLNDHVNHMKSIMNQLAGIGSNVPEDDAMAVLLNSMPAEYSNVIFTLGNLPNQSLEMMIASLLEEERRMQHSVVTISSDEIALFTKWKANQNSKSKSDEGSSKSKKNIKCFYCGKMGHYKNQCLKMKADLKSKKSTESDKTKEEVNLTAVVAESDDEADSW